MTKIRPPWRIFWSLEHVGKKFNYKLICISSILKCQNKLEGLFYNFEISWKMKKRWAMTILQCQETSNIFNCKIIVCLFEKIAHSKIGLRGVVWCISSTLFCDKSHFGGDHLWLCWLIGHASHFGCTAKIYGKIHPRSK